MTFLSYDFMSGKKIITKYTILNYLERLSRDQMIRAVNLEMLLSTEAVVMDQWATNFFEDLKKEGSYLDNRAEALIETFNEPDISVILAVETLFTPRRLFVEDIKGGNSYSFEKWLVIANSVCRQELIKSFE